MDAIVYTPNTGTTKEYASLLGQYTRLPVHSLTEAKLKIDKRLQSVSIISKLSF